MKTLFAYAIAAVLFYGILFMLLECWEKEMEIRDFYLAQHIHMIKEARR